jgi:hypothetical protein
MKIIGANGIWNAEKGGKSFTDRMLVALRLLGRDNTFDLEYPSMRAWKAYFQNEIDKRAEILVRLHVPGDVLIAHSFACLMSHRAMELGARFSKVFFFGGAAEDNLVFPDGAFQKLYNVYSQADWTLLLGSLLPWHPFGNLGRTGYKGTDTRVMNVKADKHKHNTYVDPEYIEQWARFINREMAP